MIYFKKNLCRLQPTQTTWQNQAALWSEIILAYYRHHKLYRLELSESLNSELFNFNNQGIKRKVYWFFSLFLLKKSIINSISLF